MKILLVDNAQNELEAISRHLKSIGLQTARVIDPVKGLQLLKKHTFDVVVAVDNLAKTTPFNLLKAISIKFPALIRISIQDKKCQDMNNLAHYVFSSDIDLIDIASTISSLQNSHKKITKDVVVKSVAKVKTLPSPPKVYLQLNAILKNSNTDSDKISEVVSQDPALCAKVLQFTNNTFAQGDKPLTSISDAITKMGVDTLSCIVMTAEMFSYQPDIPNYSLVDEQLHSLSTARFAASLVPDNQKQDALLAGLLHDIGKLVLFEIDKTLTLKYFDNNARTSGDIELEKRIFSTDHCQIGAYLLHTWGFPYDVIDAVLNHHNPKKLLAKNIGVAQAVYLANCLQREQDVHPEFLTHFNLLDNIEKLRERAARYR